MTAVVGYIDKSILAEVDGREIAVGIVTVPVTIHGPTTLGPITMDVEAGTPDIRFDRADGHDGCPADVTVVPYLRSGDDRMDLGELACCVECRPTLPD